MGNFPIQNPRKSHERKPFQPTLKTLRPHFFEATAIIASHVKLLARAPTESAETPWFCLDSSWIKGMSVWNTRVSAGFVFFSTSNRKKIQNPYYVTLKKMGCWITIYRAFQSVSIGWSGWNFSQDLYIYIYSISPTQKSLWFLAYIDLYGLYIERICPKTMINSGIWIFPKEFQSQVHPWRLTWNMSSWRFGRSFSFLNGGFVGSMLIFQGVYGWPNLNVWYTIVQVIQAVPFSAPIWRSLNHLKGHLTIPKRSQRIARLTNIYSTIKKSTMGTTKPTSFSTSFFCFWGRNSKIPKLQNAPFGLLL